MSSPVLLEKIKCHVKFLNFSRSSTCWIMYLSDQYKHVITISAALLLGGWREWSWGVLHGICRPRCVGLSAQFSSGPAVQYLNLWLPVWGECCPGSHKNACKWVVFLLRITFFILILGYLIIFLLFLVIMIYHASVLFFFVSLGLDIFSSNRTNFLGNSGIVKQNFGKVNDLKNICKVSFPPQAVMTSFGSTKLPACELLLSWRVGTCCGWVPVRVSSSPCRWPTTHIASRRRSTWSASPMVTQVTSGQ